MVTLNQAGSIAFDFGLTATKFTDDRVYVIANDEEHWLDVTNMSIEDTRNEIVDFSKGY